MTPQQLAQSATTSGPGIAMARTKSKPVNLTPGQGIESVELKKEVPNSFETCCAAIASTVAWMSLVDMLGSKT